MTKQQFAQYIKETILILDGATGSNLQKAGMPSGICPELWITENPKPLQELQKAYAGAGSRVVYAPTFGANPVKLAEYGLSDRTAELNKALVRISKEAVGDKAWVAGDMTMTGQLPAPLGTLTVEDMIAAYREQAKALFEAGADLIVIETMMNLQEARAALIAVREVCDLPVMATMSFNENGRTLYGTDAVTAVEVLQSLGADAVGINCGAGPDKMLPVLQKMADHAKVPLIAKPNAGLPKLGPDGGTVYDMEKEPFAAHMQALMDAGAVIVGGCCGTDPSYIRAVAEAAAGRSAEKAQKAGESDMAGETAAKVAMAQETAAEPAMDAGTVTRSAGKNSAAGQPAGRICLTTERASFPLEGTPEIYRIDPAENEELAQGYRSGEYDTLLDLLEEALDEEPDVICLSADGEGIDGKAVITDVIGETCQNVNLPLAFSSEDPAVLETALRACPGRAGIVPRGNDEKTLETLCEKYGAVILTNS